MVTTLIEAGRHACGLFDAGQSNGQVLAVALSANYNAGHVLADKQIGSLISVAVLSFCPEHPSKLGRPYFSQRPCQRGRLPR